MRPNRVIVGVMLVTMSLAAMTSAGPPGSAAPNAIREPVSAIVMLPTGVPVSVPTVGQCPPLVHQETCNAAASPSQTCPADGPEIATAATGDYCSFSLHNLKSRVLYYGDSSNPDATTGSNHNYATHDGDSHYVSWWVDWVDGVKLVGTAGLPCEQLTQSSGGWHANEMDVGLSKDSSHDPSTGNGCYTGNPEGWWGAGVNW